MASVTPVAEARRQPRPRACSVARTLEVVGEKWALLVIREAFLGVRRFEEMLLNIGAPRDTLAARLRTLVEHGVLEKRRYSDRPPREEYVLTPAGRELYPVILSLMQWGDRHLPLDGGPPMRLEHSCGHPLEHEWVCTHCGNEIDPREVTRLTR
jgi:DNA-binding HxlR family transcriptional regulator